MAPAHSYGSSGGPISFLRRKWRTTHAPDYVGFVILLTGWILIVLFVNPFHRMFYINDLRISYPFAVKERVPVFMNFVYALFIPLGVLIAYNLFARSSAAKHEVTYLSFLISIVLTSFITDNGWAEAQQCSDVLHDIQVCQQKGWNNMEYITNTDQQFIKLGLTGRTFVVCSQDEGAPGETNDGCSLDLKLALYPEYPGSSPYVTSVGATAIVGSGPNIGSSSTLKSKGKVSNAKVALANPCHPSGRYNCTTGPQQEMPCYLQNADFTTGGGFSQVEHMPTYQQATVNAYLKSGVALPPPTKFNQTNRAYPDIGALGQNTLIVMNGEWVVTGGTSAATPITAGILTLLNDYLLGQKKAPLGFVNPLLYQMAAAQKDTFNQITTGANKCTEEQCCKYGYVANPAGGWNPATGLGSPNYGNMLAYIQKNL